MLGRTQRFPRAVDTWYSDKAAHESAALCDAARKATLYHRILRLCLPYPEPRETNHDHKYHWNALAWPCGVRPCENTTEEKLRAYTENIYT